MRKRAEWHTPLCVGVMSTSSLLSDRAGIEKLQGSSPSLEELCWHIPCHSIAPPSPLPLPLPSPPPSRRLGLT